MKIDVDFDELMQTALNGSIEASEKLADNRNLLPFFNIVLIALSIFINLPPASQ